MAINGAIIMCKKYTVPHVITPQLHSCCGTYREEMAYPRLRKCLHGQASSLGILEQKQEVGLGCKILVCLLCTSTPDRRGQTDLH